ncbi:MAG: TonB-dependent receptor [Cyclobacteriaceae bacterium]|jgi:hypothetical protein|nr:TonB-dependent receptor [Cyclobacteriaceae bacterium]
MEAKEKLTTQEKALRINLRREVYGSFAEIGAGQEVAANFFKVGGASGTVAKTMSAYDMKFSDAIYGVCDRYVCEDRLTGMLDHEYPLLPERLPHLIEKTRFFAFADTVEALNFERTNQGQGWVGLRFQKRPNTEPNDCVIHVKMFDNDPLLQQYALGVVGVNMIYACMMLEDPEEIMMSLVDGLARRIEIDMFRLSGPDYEKVDNRLMAMKLVKNGLTRAAMFGPDGEVMQPSEALYKKNVLVLRGRFRPVTHVNVDMLLAARRYFKKEPDVDKKKMVVLTELTLNDLSSDGAIDEKDFLYRADTICSLGQTVLISNYFEYYRVAEYLSKITRGKKIGIILGIYALQKVFEERTYQNLRGGILESFAALFGTNIKLYIYPALKRGSDTELFTLKDFEDELPDNLKGLFRYMQDNNKLEDIENANTENLHIISDNVLAMIRKGEHGWEKYVPHKVEEAIKEHGLFDYPYTLESSKVASVNN